jgi:hypothetical protein
MFDTASAPESSTVNVPPYTSVRVTSVHVCAVVAEESNSTPLKWFSDAKLHGVNVESPVAESNKTNPVPASQTAVSVDSQSKAPLRVHVSLPKSMADAIDEMFTAPVMVTAPDVDVRSPPLIVSDPADVIANVLLANVPPEMVRAFVTMTAVASVTVPAETVKSSNVLSVESKVIVAVASNVWMPVPCVNTELAPELFQLPETVQAPVVMVNVPLVPPVIVNVLMMTVLAFAVKMPPFPMLTSGVSAIAPSARSAVARAVVETVSETVRVVSQRMPRVAIVNVCAVPEDDVNVTEANSASARFAPANVNVPSAPELNVTVLVPAFQEAEVVAFVHVPVTVHEEEPRSI